MFSILDHFIRRNEGQERVIGTLLGTVTDDVVEVTNCFAVPHYEKDEEVAVGKDLHKQMYSLFSKVNEKEQIVGWYSTPFEGAAITDACCLIQEFYSSECVDPVHVVLDTTLAADHLAARAFVTVRLEAAERSLAVQFEEVPLQVQGEVDATAALARMSVGSGGKNEVWELGPANNRGHASLLHSHALSQPLNAVPGAAVSGRAAAEAGGSAAEAEVAAAAAVAQHASASASAVEAGLVELLSMLETASAYVADVQAGRRAGSHAAGRQIAAALATVPRLSAEALTSVLGSGVQDLLLVSYLANLTRAQLAVASRLTLTGI